MTKTLISLIFIAIAVNGFSQGVSFTYDESGNRTGRKLLAIGKIDNESTDGDDQNLTWYAGDVASFIENYTATIDDITIVVNPNPNAGRFNITMSKLPKECKAEFYLHSMSGSLVYECREPERATLVDISNSENGTYILTVVVNGTKETWKIIKQ